MSESIENILHDCLTEMEKGRSVEKCLGEHPQWRDELAPLLRTATRLRSAPRVKTSAAFRRSAALRMASLIGEGKGPLTEPAYPRPTGGARGVLRRAVHSIVGDL